MSSQVNFYALPEDRPAFKQWLEEREMAQKEANILYK